MKKHTAAADDGCTSRADLQALDQHGSSLAWLLHHSVLETSDETPSAFDIYKGSSLFKLSIMESELRNGKALRLSMSQQVGLSSVSLDGPSNGQP